MFTLRRLVKPITPFLLLSFLTLTLYIPAAHAGLVGTDAVVDATQHQEARDHLRAMLDREDVKQALLARGVDADHVQARVDALTDQEAQQLASNMDQLHAGAGALELAVFVFIVLLITDILGFTDIFPFVKKTAN